MTLIVADGACDVILYLDDAASACGWVWGLILISGTATDAAGLADEYFELADFFGELLFGDENLLCF